MGSSSGRTPEEDALLDKAARLLPGGILGGYSAPRDLSLVVREGRGPRLVDVSGREYIDYILGSGPLVLGHAHPAVIAAVERQLSKGTTYFQLSEPTLALAEEICRAVPCAEQVRFTSSGSEATFFALRVARAFRGREKILKFEGGFHGTHDYSLMSVGPHAPKAYPAPTPDSAGIPHAIQEHVLIAPFNDLAETEAILAAHHGDLAALIMEPFQRLIPPDTQFLRGVREITRRFGVPLIFDEIVTGFRFAYGGAQEYYGVVPDLAALGKIVGGGFALAAVVGRADIMRHLAPELEGTPEFVAQAGTLNGNPIAAAAGLATLAELRRPGTYARLFATGTRLQAGLASGPGRQGGGRAARIRDLLHGPTHHRLPRKPRRGPRASRRVHAGDARAGRGQGRGQVLRVPRAWRGRRRPHDRDLRRGARGGRGIDTLTDEE